VRIAAHISAREWGGAERRSIILLAALVSRGHDVVVYCNTERIAEKARAAGLRTYIRPLRGDGHIDDAIRFARMLQRQQPDVLIAVTFRRLWLAALAARLARVPRVIARVGLASDVARNAKYRFVLRRWVHDVVVNAHSLKQPFVDALPRGSRARVSVIPNGIDLTAPTTSREQSRDQLDIPRDAFVIGTVARLVQQKRIDRILDAMVLVDDVFAVITGDGGLRSELEARAQQLGIAQRVRFTGARDDVANVLVALDAFVIASLQEGMSSAMLEALAAGVPVISTPVTGAEVLLEEPVSGIVADPTPEAIADAIRALRSDPARRKSLAAAATRKAADTYTTRSMADAWEHLLTNGA
jgi:glycosyltransferase involved in cell wall biosynthesis